MLIFWCMCRLFSRAHTRNGVVGPHGIPCLALLYMSSTVTVPKTLL